MKAYCIAILAMCVLAQARAAEQTKQDAASLLDERVSHASPNFSIQPPKGWKKRGATATNMVSYDIPTATELLFSGFTVTTWKTKDEQFNPYIANVLKAFTDPEYKGELADKSEVKCGAVSGRRMVISFPKGRFAKVPGVLTIVVFDNGLRLDYRVPADNYVSLKPGIEASIQSFKGE